MKRVIGNIGSLLRRYPLLIVAVIVAIAFVGGAYYYAAERKKAAEIAHQEEFDPSSVLPAPITQPEVSAVYTADSLKAFDGKGGRKCYVAVKQTVYEIKDSSYWRNGKHTPSGGRGVCGGDMTEVIKKSPHGESILSQLPKVGTYK